MKKKLILIILVLFFGLVITGCDKEENGGTNNIKYLYTENGINIRKIEAYLVGGTTPNLSVVFSNTTSEDKEFDLSKFAIKYGNGKEGDCSFFTTTVIGANKTYQQLAITFKADDLKVGDVVEIYYNQVKLVETEVTKFG